MRIGFLLIVAFSFVCLSIAEADVLCVRNSVKANKKGVVKLKNAITAHQGSTCPRGHSPIVDTSVFTGPQGPRGYSSWEQMPPGQIIRGRITKLHSTLDVVALISVQTEFPAYAPVTIMSDKIIIKNNIHLQGYCPVLSDCLLGQALTNSQTLSHLCTGTFAVPDAAEGYVCVYPGIFDNVSSLVVRGGISQTGFLMSWQFKNTVSSGVTEFDATWAYRAPSTASASRATSGRGEMEEIPGEFDLGNMLNLP